MGANKGIDSYQEQQRRETLRKIDEAITSLRESGLKVTKTSIAEESGYSRYALRADYIKAHLRTYPEFNPDIAPLEDPDITIAKLEERLITTTRSLESSRKHCKLLEAEKIRLKQELKDLDSKYRHLLGAYQEEVGAKHIKF